MRVAKRFRWEAAHRLPWHQGGCASLHGHSYTLHVEVEGDVDERGMLVDFKELRSWVRPLIDGWDHSTLVAANDAELLDIVTAGEWKHAILPYDTTAENLCRFALDLVCREQADRLSELGIRAVSVKISETETCYAETSRRLA
jgi:6-pyruvoyltetrahydropterin/6-carboxytetrahydropterin synthase